MNEQAGRFLRLLKAYCWFLLALTNALLLAAALLLWLSPQSKLSRTIQHYASPGKHPIHLR